MIIYAVGDIHGELDLLEQMVTKIEQHRQDHGYLLNEIELVFLGDYVDRGPDSKGVIKYLMKLPDTYECTFLKGNHEDLFLRSIRGDVSALHSWYGNGAKQTLKSYAHPDDPGDPSNLTGHLSDVPASHEEWLMALHDYYETDNHIFVHAGLLPGKLLAEQFTEHLYWIREPFLEVDPTDRHVQEDYPNGVFPDGKHIVHGHTPHPYDYTQDLCKAFRTNLDSGAFFTGTLTCGVFDSKTNSTPLEYIRVAGGDASFITLRNNAWS